MIQNNSVPQRASIVVSLVHPRGFEPLTWYRRPSVAGQPLRNATDVSGFSEVTCARKTKTLTVTPLSRFYTVYVRLPPVLGHFSDSIQCREKSADIEVTASFHPSTFAPTAYCIDGHLHLVRVFPRARGVTEVSAFCFFDLSQRLAFVPDLAFGRLLAQPWIGGSHVRTGKPRRGD
jgi:hypothetical protein